MNNPSLVGSSANSTIDYYYMNADVETISRAVGVQVNGPGDFTMTGNMLIMGSDAYANTYSQYMDGDLRATSEVTGLVLDGQGDALLINNIVNAYYSYATIDTETGDNAYPTANAKGIVLSDGGEPVLINNTIYVYDPNATATVGGGSIIDEAFMYAVEIDGPSCLMVNDILWTSGDTPDIDTNLLRITGGDVTLANNDFYDDPYSNCLVLSDTTCVDAIADVNDCAQWDMCTTSTSNITDDPGGWPDIASDSDCVDNGADPSDFGYTVDVDVDGESRPYGDDYDIGADEYHP
jgi:hypothetical protein